MGPHKGEKHKIIHDFGDGSYNITPQKHSRFIKYKQGAAKAKENQLKLVKEEVEEARKAAKDVGLECQECGKRFRSANPRYGITKCPKCKSTDLDLAYGEEVEIDEMPNRANKEKINSLLKKYSGKFKWKDEVLYVEGGIEKDVMSQIRGRGLVVPTIRVSSTPMREARSKEDEVKLAKAIAAWKRKGGKVKKLPPGKKFQSLFGKGYKPKKQPRQAEEVEITEVLKSKDKSVIDAFYDKDSLVGRLLSTNGRSLQKHGMGGQTIAAWLKGKIAIVAVSDVKSTESILRYMKNSIPKLNFDPKSYKKFFEEVEIEEKRSATGYELYHKDFSSAMQHAYKFAKSKGHVIDPKEIDDKVATGPKKPSSGKTNRYSLKAGRKKVEIQVANLDNKRYELNMYIESENTASKHPLEVRRKKYVELNKKDTLNPLNKVKEALTRMKERSLVEKPEEIELEEILSPNQAAIDAFLKKGGKINDPKYAPVLKKRKKINVADFQKSFANTKQKEKDADKKAKRHYVSGGGKQDGSIPYNSSDYITHKDINKFPRSLASGIQKIISGAKMQKYEIKTKRYGKIPGMGITFPGSTTPKLMIQFDEDTKVRDPNYNSGWTGKGSDPQNFRKFQMAVWVNEAATSKDRETGKIDWYQRKEFEGKTADVVAKRTLQYLKTKVKRMAKEEVEIDEAKSKLPPHLAKFFDKDGNLKKDAADRVAKGRAKLNWKDVTPKGYGPKEEVEEGIDIEKASMGAVIKDFQNSDAPQFKGKSDKKRREMAIAAKLSKEENEDDDPVGKSKKNSKKDKVNLKPKMDETMKNYKEFMKKVKETRSQTQEKTGDEAEYQEKRKEVLKKFGVESCSQCETEKEKKACYKALDDAHVADHEEQTQVKEAVTTGGIEYGEQDWDVQHRIENSYPNIDANYAEFHEQGLEGPYLWHGETYFFDRKVGGWYSVTAEDYVDDEISKDLSLAYVKDGMYKRQFAS